MIMKDVLVMAWGKTKDGSYYPKQEVKIPKEFISINNFDRKLIGFAENFKTTDKGLICEVEIYDEDLTDKTNTISPEFIGKEIMGGFKNLELEYLSLVENHACEDCQNNLIKWSRLKIFKNLETHKIKSDDFIKKEDLKEMVANAIEYLEDLESRCDSDSEFYDKDIGNKLYFGDFEIFKNGQEYNQWAEATDIEGAIKILRDLFLIEDLKNGK